MKCFFFILGATVPQLQDEFGWLNPKMAQEYISTSRAARRNMDGKLNLNVGAESDDSEAEEEQEMSKKVSKKVVKGKKGQAKRKESRSDSRSDSGSDSGSSSDSDSDSDSGSGSGSDSDTKDEQELQMDVEERSISIYNPLPVDRQDVLHQEDLGGPAIEEPLEEGEEREKEEREREEREREEREKGRKVVTFQEQQVVNVKENTGFSQLAQVIKNQNPEKIIFVSNCSGTFNF